MRRLFTIVATCLAALATKAAAQQAKPLFAASDAIHITIQAPLGTLIHDREIQTPIDGILTDPSGQHKFRAHD